MPTLALISDIHGNATALRAVLAAIGAVDSIICLGDLVADGAEPQQVIELLQEHDIPCVQGNTDAFMLDPQPYVTPDATRRRYMEIGLWSAAQLSGTERDYLRALPLTRHLENFLCYHASPRHNEELILPTTPDETLTAIFADVTATFCAGGHTHAQMLRRWGDKVLINPGSVGMAYHRWSDGRTQPVTYAEYALLTINDDDFSLSFHRVDYDIQAYFRAIRTSTIPHAEWIISRFNV